MLIFNSFLNDSTQLSNGGCKKIAILQHSFNLNNFCQTIRFVSQKQQISSNVLSYSYGKFNGLNLSTPFSCNLNNFFFYRRRAVFDNMFRIKYQKKKKVSVK